MVQGIPSLWEVTWEERERWPVLVKADRTAEEP